MKYGLLVVAFALLTGASGTCSDQGAQDPGSIEGEGVIQRGVGPECPDVWHIAAQDGHQYWPVEDVQFQKEGLRVRFRVRPKQGAVSSCMAGTIVEVISIQQR